MKECNQLLEVLNNTSTRILQNWRQYHLDKDGTGLRLFDGIRFKSPRLKPKEMQRFLEGFIEGIQSVPDYTIKGN